MSLVTGKDISDSKDSKGESEKATKLVECECTRDSFEGVKNVVTDSGNGYEIRCLKSSKIVISNEREDYKVSLDKFYLSLDPEMSLILNILEEEWVRHLMSVDEGRWVSSQTSKGLTDSHPDTYTTAVSRTRKSSSVIFEHFEDEIITKIERRVSLVAGIDVSFLEKLVMVRYRPGDYFNVHHDGAFRSHTVLLYLNDSEGGETVFPRIGLAIKPIANSAVFWKNVTGSGSMDERLIHAGTTPSRGLKYVVNCFFNKDPIRLM